MKENRSHKIKTLPITDLEKSLLKNRILNSVDNIPKRKSRVKPALAVFACSAFLISLGVYLLGNSTPSVTEFVDNSGAVDVNSVDDIVLILGEGENLEIGEEESTINYSNSGKKVTIGSGKEVNQEALKNDKVVFNTILVPYGKRSSRIKLSDGTSVWLNSGSRLVYPVVFNGDRRELFLEGEAIFDVAHNKEKPFIVISENQEIKVLGTVFCVTNYKDEDNVNTVLKSGSVQIKYIKKGSTKINPDKVRISPGTKASFNKTSKRIVSEKVNVDNYFSWRDGVFIFKNNSLDYITKRISRYYNFEIKISDKALAEETFSGYLDLNDSIQKVMETIKISAKMNYSIEENKVTIN